VFWKAKKVKRLSNPARTTTFLRTTSYGRFARATLYNSFR